MRNFIVTFVTVFFLLCPFSQKAFAKRGVDDIRDIVYPIIVTSETLASVNTDFTRRREAKILSSNVAKGLSCVYWGRRIKEKEYLTEAIIRTIGVPDAAEQIHQAALGNFLALIQTNGDNSPFTFAKDEIFGGKMLVISTKDDMQEWRECVHSFVLMPDVFIPMLETEFKSVPPEEGYYLILLKGGELLVAPADNANALRLQVFINENEDRKNLFLTDTIYHLTREKIEPLFRRTIKKLPQHG